MLFIRRHNDGLIQIGLSSISRACIAIYRRVMVNSSTVLPLVVANVEGLAQVDLRWVDSV